MSILLILKILGIISGIGVLAIFHMLRNNEIIIPFEKKENNVPLINSIENTRCSLIQDGDVDKINVHKDREGGQFLSLDLSHRANNWSVILYEKELEYLLKTLRESKNDNI